ncbi:MAG: NosD domain-containing protein [Planctomycetota bacterium]|jgi:parallel beta-helix repeat protein
MTHQSCVIWNAAALLVSACIVASSQAGTIPTNGMVITTDTTFEPGTYNLPDGVSIGASGITLDMNGAELVGTDFDNYGVTCIGFDEVTIANGTVRNYYYGFRIENGSGIQILDNDLSDNWVDPLSQLPGAPFLNINVGPTLGDRTNLGGGLYVRTVSGATISGNTLCNQENGMDLYFVTGSAVTGNNASGNTGWGIHLNGSTGNVISGNTCDDCIRPGLGDSAGVLVVRASNNNQFLNNSFQGGGDGFFIGNEHGCPSNDNLVQGNNGSSAGANAFEATFSSGNQFIDNIAHGSNYGFWLGYSHSGNVIRGNSIRANNVNGIEIEHGQNNVIEANEIVGNGGKGIVLRTDGLVHFPPAQYPCLNLPDQAASSGYTITDNIIQSNFGIGLELINTTDSQITNNLIAGNLGGTATSNGAANTWAVAPAPAPEGNIVGGPYFGGNYWDNYDGVDTDGDELGDTNVPYTNGGLIAPPGDPHPLIGDPPIDDFDNPQTLCNRSWIDLGRNTRGTGQVFDTANGAHFATDGVDLYLLEGSNSNRLNQFNSATSRYESRALVPESVWDGGGFQFGGGLYFATVGVQFDPPTGTGKGPKLYAYDPVGNSWSPRADSTASGDPVANEALAYDPVHHRLYATVVAVTSGADPTLRRRLAIYDIATDTWTGTTSPADTEFGAGSEAEYLDGSVYVWRGMFDGGAVNGSDSYLHVYDIDSDSWSTTPAVQASGVVPGFRSGAFDIWGVVITADPVRGLLFVIGGEANRQVYVFDVASQTWSVTPTAVYDGGWGDGMEYVAASDRLYQIDGRNALATPQGTAVLVPSVGDLDHDGAIGIVDFLILLGVWGACEDPCCSADLDEDGMVGITDFLLLLAHWG